MTNKGSIKAPITRNNMFYSEEDFQLENDIVEGYFEEDLNQVVVVYEVDRQKTTVSETYQEASSGRIRYKNPKEIPCMFEIVDGQNKSYDGKTNNAVYLIGGNMTLYVTEKILERYRCEISRGDYLGVPIAPNEMIYYVVTNDGKVNTSNKSYIGAYRKAWRTISATSVTDLSEFNG